MSRELERIYSIHHMLRQRYPPAFRAMQERLEVSAATLKRDLAFMRDRLLAPIVYDRGRGCYRYDPASFELPGVWFTEAELSALLVLDGVLQDSPLNRYTRDLSAKIRALLETGAGAGTDKLSERIRVVNPGRRTFDSGHFETLCRATIRRRRLRMQYFTRSRRANTERVVSPQQIICYRSNWYFDAWCHHSDALRRFAVDAIEDLVLLEEPALEAPGADLSGYGIFRGSAPQTASLLFDETASRWITREVWHGEQVLTPYPGGRLRLDLPFTHPQEIVMDILRHGANVEVLSPRSLRQMVAAAHRDAARLYDTPRKTSAALALQPRAAAR